MKYTLKDFLKNLWNSPSLRSIKFWQLTVFPVLLIIIAGLANAAMDTVSFHWGTSIFTKYNPNYFNPAVSWVNKWRIENGAITGEKFLFSSTFFVALTDFWHTCKFLYQNCLIAAMVLFVCTALESNRLGYWVTFFALKILLMVSFSTGYDWLFIR